MSTWRKYGQLYHTRSKTSFINYVVAVYRSGSGSESYYSRNRVVSPTGKTGLFTCLVYLQEVTSVLLNTDDSSDCLRVSRNTGILGYLYSALRGARDHTSTSTETLVSA
ncbi:hypothetical protein OTU49_011962 [Cherax quadricarinatus]|uniref:Uncharacterized protein n=1 Tax=Cherax quadricarinatus TaxID=27406 RepID=A0AAW0W1D8_CHEQU